MAARPRLSEIEGLTKPALVNAVRLLVLVALAISGYLLWVSLNHGVPIGCGPQSDCDKVLGSKWAYWLGVPVSALAVAVDLLVLFSTLLLRTTMPAVAQRRAWAVLVPCSLLLIGAAIWFVSVQVFAVQAICPYCMVAHSCGTVAGILLLIAAPIRQAPDRLWDLDIQVFVTTRRFKRAFFLVLFALSLLVLGQVWYEPATGLVTSIPGSGPAPSPISAPSTQTLAQAVPPPNAAATNANATNAASSPPAPVVAEPLPPAPPPRPGPRLLPIYNGQIQLNVDEAPLIGSPTNRHAVVSLFDYTCHHCRAMHPRLVEAQQAFSNTLVILSLPMPLDPDCNPTMLKPHPSHTNACDYARLALAVWRVDRAKHREFDDWLFAPERPPPLPEARQFAIQLVGADSLENAMRDPWVAQQLRQDVAAYEIAYRARQGSMPQLIFPTNVAVGTFLPDQLFKLLDDNLGLKKAP